MSVADRLDRSLETRTGAQTVEGRGLSNPTFSRAFRR